MVTAATPVRSARANGTALARSRGITRLPSVPPDTPGVLARTLQSEQPCTIPNRSLRRSLRLPGGDGGNDLRDHTECRQDHETNTDLSPLCRIIRQGRRLPSEAFSFHGRLLDRVASPMGPVPDFSRQLVIVS